MKTRLAKKTEEMSRNEANKDATKGLEAARGQDGDEWPSDKELWKLLKEVQENTKLLKEVQANTAKLLTDNQEQRRLYEELKSSLDFETTKREELESRVATLEEELKKETKRSIEAEQKLLEEEVKLDDLQQYTRKYNLEICGASKDVNMTDREIVLAIAKEIGVEMVDNDLDIVHRLKKTKGTPPIIVRFSTYRSKQRLYGARKHLRNKSWSDVLGYDTSVFFNENLTPKRSMIFREVRKVVKERKYFGTWSIDGKILLKKDKDDYPIMIKSLEDIKKL